MQQGSSVLFRSILGTVSLARSSMNALSPEWERGVQFPFSTAEDIMRRPLLVVALSWMVLWLTGCSDRPGLGPNPATGTSNRQPSPPPPPQPPSTTTDASKSPTPRVSQQPIRLSAGVALPQTGPDGILMSFSVDYEFTEGEPSSSEYVWVIERAHGSPASQLVKLCRQGNLPILINGWRPEDGPFQTHMEDRNGNRLSTLMELQ